MTIRHALPALLCLAILSMAGSVSAAPLAPGRSDTVSGSHSMLPVDYRPYYHCHGPKRCHGKGNYYKYSPNDPPSYEPFKYGCRYGCGYNNGWNSPSSRFDYTGRRYGRHHRRHRH